MTLGTDTRVPSFYFTVGGESCRYGSLRNRIGSSLGRLGPSRLVFIVGVLLAMTDLLLLGQLVPLGLDLFPLVLPLFAYDFGNLRVGDARVGGYGRLLVVLSVENECYLIEKVFFWSVRVYR